MSFLNVSGISKKIDRNFVVNNVSFRQEQFEKIAIAGETGSGKSTLLKIIGGLLQPDEGVVVFENEKVLGPEEKLLPGHPRIAYLSQHFELRNNYTVEEVLLMANKLSDTEAEIIYNVCRISHLLKRRTDQLSGGEKQRIATARLLISSPRLLLLDEPFSNLDIIHKNILKAVINDIGEQLNITCIISSHDPSDTLSWADKILVMKEGQIVQEGTPKQIYGQPEDEYVASLFGKYNLIDFRLAQFLEAFQLKMPFGKRLVVRPENFKPGTEEHHHFVGIVNSVGFFGSYYETEVLILNQNFTIRIENNNFIKGDTIYLLLVLDFVTFV